MAWSLGLLCLAMLARPAMAQSSGDEPVAAEESPPADPESREPESREPVASVPAEPGSFVPMGRKERRDRAWEAERDAVPELPPPGVPMGRGDRREVARDIALNTRPTEPEEGVPMGRQERVQLARSKENFRWTPFIVPGVSPELGGSLSIGALITLRTDPEDQASKRSSASMVFGITTTAAVFANILPTLYFSRDRIRVEGQFWFKNMPDNYWGVGYQNALSLEQGKDTTRYERRWWWVRTTMVYEFQHHFFLGGLLDFNQTIATDVNENMATDPDFLEFGPNNYNGGIGVVARYDSRDVPVNAFEGYYFELSLTGYGPWLASDNLYGIVDFDYRHYITLGRRAGSTLSWQLNNRSGFGSIPYGELSMVGDPFGLRGYYWGRFRDKIGMWALTEYRYMLPTRREKRPGFMRHGFVGWVGLGWVTPRYFTGGGAMPNAGLGYRFEVQPRMNVRVDFGVGRDSFGVYAQFLEAF